MRKRSDSKDTEAPRAVVPLDPINEAVIIAAVCVDIRTANELLPVYDSGYFFAKGHARIWEVLQAMQRQELYYDPATVHQMSGGDVSIAYLEELVRERPARPPNLRHHVEALANDRTRVEVAQGPLASLLEALKDPTTEFTKLRSLAASISDGFAGHGSGNYIIRGARVAEEADRELRDRRTGRALYSTGIRGLDVDESGDHRIIPGTAPKDITLVTGVSGSGKSTILARMLLGMTLGEWIDGVLVPPRQKRRILIGAWEMGRSRYIELMAAIHVGMSRSSLMMGEFEEADQIDMKAAMDEVAASVDFFEIPFGRARGTKKGELLNDRQIDLISQVVQDSRCDVFVADLMRRVFKETNPDDEEQALFRLQAMGKQLNVHQIWAHQQRLKDMERRDKRPSQGSIKGSAAWVETPDMILATHREALHRNVTDDRIETIVLKQRYGRWPLAVEFDWNGEFVTLGNPRTIEYHAVTEADDMDAQLLGGKRR